MHCPSLARAHALGPPLPVLTPLSSGLDEFLFTKRLIAVFPITQSSFLFFSSWAMGSPAWDPPLYYLAICRFLSKPLPCVLVNRGAFSPSPMRKKIPFPLSLFPFRRWRKALLSVMIFDEFFSFGDSGIFGLFTYFPSRALRAQGSDALFSDVCFSATFSYAMDEFMTFWFFFPVSPPFPSQRARRFFFQKMMKLFPWLSFPF